MDMIKQSELAYITNPNDNIIKENFD